MFCFVRLECIDSRAPLHRLPWLR